MYHNLPAQSITKSDLRTLLSECKACYFDEGDRSNTLGERMLLMVAILRSGLTGAQRAEAEKVSIEVFGMVVTRDAANAQLHEEWNHLTDLELYTCKSKHKGYVDYSYSTALQDCEHVPGIYKGMTFSKRMEEAQKLNPLQTVATRTTPLCLPQSEFEALLKACKVGNRMTQAEATLNAVKLLAHPRITASQIGALEEFVSGRVDEDDEDYDENAPPKYPPRTNPLTDWKEGHDLFDLRYARSVIRHQTGGVERALEWAKGLTDAAPPTLKKRKRKL